jgi:hypothetical protein
MARAVCTSAPLSGAAPFLRSCRALADKALHLKLRVLGHLFANADLLDFHGCKVLHHLNERERERGRLEQRLKDIQ